MSNAQVWYALIASSIILLLAVIMFATAVQQRDAHAAELRGIRDRVAATERQPQQPPDPANLSWKSG